MAIISRNEHAEWRHYKSPEVKVIGDRAVRFRDVAVHEFQMGDVEDPDLYAAEPILQWELHPAGKFIMENAIDKPQWHRHLDHTYGGYQYAITAELEAKKLSEYYLKWGNDGSSEIR